MVRIQTEQLIRGKTFLVTGGTGSFGHYISRFLLDHGAKEVTIFSRDEEKQYSMLFELKSYKDKVQFIIGDVRDKDALLQATKGVDIVFHAAALKQIPSTEYNILEAIKTNVMGAQNIVDACIANHVHKAIAISTDKAVEPVNVMGMTKALQERIFTLANTKKNGTKTIFACVRYGNVINSRGSVIPLFLKQLEKGENLTVTHPEMTRFVIRLSEAIQLILFALQDAKGGEIFIPDIRPLRIIDLAEVLLEQNGIKKGNYRITGMRPGEKLHETLISPVESLFTQKKQGFYIIHPHIDLGKQGVQYEQKFVRKGGFRFVSNEAELLSQDEIRKVLEAEGIIVRSSKV